MDTEEFDRFMAQSMGFFPQLKEHLNRLSQSDRTDVLDGWEKALKAVDSRHAMESLELMVCGEAKRPEYGWSDFPALIRMAAFEIRNIELAQRSQRYESASRVKCQYCMDASNGMVRVYNPRFLAECKTELLELRDSGEQGYVMVEKTYAVYAAWKRTNREPMHIPTVCCCQSPTAETKRQSLSSYLSGASRRKSSPCALQVYDDSRMCRYRSGSCVEICDWYDDDTKRGYSSDFAEWS